MLIRMRQLLSIWVHNHVIAHIVNNMGVTDISSDGYYFIEASTCHFWCLWCSDTWAPLWNVRWKEVYVHVLCFCSHECGWFVCFYRGWGWQKQ